MRLELPALNLTARLLGCKRGPVTRSDRNIKLLSLED